MKDHQNYQADLLEKICSYALSRKAPFTPKHIVMHIASSFKNQSREELAEAVENILSTDDNFFVRYPEDSPEPVFCRKGVFMKGAEFCSTPEADEVKKGIFIPGDFFSIFIKENTPFANIKMLYLNKEPHLNVIQHEINRQAYQKKFPFSKNKLQSSSGKKIPVLGFDFAEFYSKSGFAGGDSILFRVEDYDNGIFSFRKKSSLERQNPQVLKQYVLCLEQCLLNVADEFGEFIDIRDQLESLFYNAPELLKNPPISLEEFLKASDAFSIKETNGHCFLSPKKQRQKKEIAGQNGEASITSSPHSNLGEILDYLGLAVMPEIIVSYIKNALFRKDPLDSVYNRLMKFSPHDFADEAQKVCFEIMMEDLWEQISEHYDSSSDTAKSYLREKLLDVYDQILSQVLEIENREIMLDSIPKDDFAQFSAYLSDLCDSLINLDCSNKDISQEDIEQIEKILKSAGDTLRISQKILEIKAGKRSKE